MAVVSDSLVYEENCVAGERENSGQQYLVGVDVFLMVLSDASLD